MIDIEKLRQYLLNEYFAAYKGGDFGTAFVDMLLIRQLTEEELIKLAEHNKIDLKKFEI